jgi:hypothetical protein
MFKVEAVVGLNGDSSFLTVPRVQWLEVVWSKGVVMREHPFKLVKLTIS